MNCDNDTPPERQTHGETGARIETLKAAARLHPAPSELLTKVPENADIEPGQVWGTRPEPEFPEHLPETCRSEDPCLVLVLDASHEPLDGHRALTVAPLLVEAEMAGPTDVLLPRSVLGFEAAAAVGSSVGMLADNLADCRGALPASWRERIDGFRRYLQGIAASRPPAVRTGPEYLDEMDLRYRFHEELVDRLEYLQLPYLVWMERCGMLAWKPAEQPGGIFDWIAEFVVRFDEGVRRALSFQLGQLAALPPQGGQLDERWSRAIVFEGDLGDLVHALAVTRSKEGAPELRAASARVHTGIEENPDRLGACMARWEITQAPEAIQGGEGFSVYDLHEHRIIGSGDLSTSGRFAVLREGNWADFASPSRDPARLVLLIQKGSAQVKSQ